MMEAMRSFETLVLTRATRRNIPEDDILQLYISYQDAFWELYRVALVRSDVSENVSSSSSVFLMVIRFHSCVTVESLLLSIPAFQHSSIPAFQQTVFFDHKQYRSVERRRYNDSVVTQLWNPITLRDPADGDDTFSETSVRTTATRYKVPEGIYWSVHNLEDLLHSCQFGGFHGYDYEEYHLLGCDTVWFL
jgi:hypothetical protein